MAKIIVSEEDLIQTYLAPLAAGYPGAFGLKDDCAVLQPPAGLDLVMTTDAVVAGTHFFADEMPENIAWRALAVNVSDLAAKGATPHAYLMALSFPEAPATDWMMRFSSGLKEAQDHFRLSLIGGDSDRRAGVSLSITITAIGTVPHGKMVRRGTPKLGDRLFVSGTLGDAALGLVLRRNADAKRFPALSKDDRAFLLDRYLRPNPRVELSALLIEFASAAMDISDGLAKDLGRMCKAAGNGAAIGIDELPLSSAAARIAETSSEVRSLALSGGDDYEVLCSVPAAKAEAFADAALDAGVAVTDIGEITGQGGLVITDASGADIIVPKSGYDHF